MQHRTLTVRRGDVDVTVEFRRRRGSSDWKVAAAVDEDGRKVKLTARELHQATMRVLAGEDESGR